MKLGKARQDEPRSHMAAGGAPGQDLAAATRGARLIQIVVPRWGLGYNLLDDGLTKAFTRPIS